MLIVGLMLLVGIIFVLIYYYTWEKTLVDSWQEGICEALHDIGIILCLFSLPVALILAHFGYW